MEREILNYESAINTLQALDQKSEKSVRLEIFGNSNSNSKQTRAAKLTAMNKYRQTRRRKKHLFRKKKGNSTIRL
jgi:hypothetical protein